jgi:hypothetical protein
MIRKAIVLLALLAATAVLAGDDATTEWSPAVYPTQRLPLVFSHAKHLARGAQCATCHPAATTSRSAVDNLIPTEAACRGCHAIDRGQPDKQATPVAACAGCHVGYAPDRPVERVYLIPTPLKFDHAAHVKAPCERCHGNMRAVDLATTLQLPTMGSCLTCHTNGSEERHCADCHLTKLGGLIATDLEHGRLVPGRDGLGDEHGPGFARDHKQQARQVGATCTACHDRSECVDCHQGVVKPMEFHPGDYLLTHPIDARRGRPDCSACHRYESFCVGCHEREGLGTRALSAFDASDPTRQFHPAGWATAGVGPNRHAQEARRNISSCASCHREEDCLKCHTAEPGNMVRASPHPAGWRGSARCRALDRGNRRMCLRCHITQDELGCDWSK